ncbi:MAG TPA: ABC transporter ATP-binding protein [Actinomycetota bacterium]|nr:ABC transporter ATP-binding protein [Actinomycetota bacterium]
MALAEPIQDIAPDTSAPAAVETIALRKTYGSLVAIDHLDLRVPTGTIYGLIGPNGAGKTTTFSVLSTLLTPTSGAASIMGHDPVEAPTEVRRVLGYMPDFFGVYDDVKVHEYLDFFAAAYRLPAASRRAIVSDLLELVDLSHKADSFVDSLSRGMKQRLGLARALVHDPQVLILDEPASGLDPRARVELRELMLELQRMGKTVLISSHILSELEEVCTYIGILEAGRLLVQGRPSEISGTGEGGRNFRVRLADPAKATEAVAVLVQQRGVSLPNEAESGVTFLLSGDDEAAAQVLSSLVAAGVAVTEFREMTTGLEELFMKVTKGVVQ